MKKCFTMFLAFLMALVPLSASGANHDATMRASATGTNSDHEYVTVSISTNIYYENGRWVFYGAPSITAEAKNWGHSLRNTTTGHTAIDAKRTLHVTVNTDVYDGANQYLGRYNVSVYFYVDGQTGEISTSSYYRTGEISDTGAYVSEEAALPLFQSILEEGSLDADGEIIHYNGKAYGYQGIKAYVERQGARTQGVNSERSLRARYTYQNDAPYNSHDKRVSSALAHMYLQPGQSYRVNYGASRTWESSANASAGFTAAEIVNIGVGLGWNRSYTATLMYSVTITNTKQTSSEWGIYPIYVVHSADLYDYGRYVGPITFTEAVSYGIDAFYY